MNAFSFIKKPARTNKTISIDSSLGNVLITGGSRKATEEVIRDYAIDTVNNNIGLVVFRDHKSGVSCYPSISSSGRLIHEIDCTENSTTEQINAFSGMTDSEINSYIIKLFDMYNEIDKSRKMSYQSYVTMLRSLAQKAGKRVRLNNLADFPIEELETLNSSFCTGTEFNRNDRFLNSIRAEISELESYFLDFSTNAAGYVLSGKNSIEQIFKTKPIIEVSLDFAGKAEESTIIMSAIIDAISRADFTSAPVSGINTVVDGAPNSFLIDSGLQKLIKSSKSIKVLFSVQDISNLVETSNEWIDYADSYFFFRQNSNNNKEFCSAFFGEYEKKKETVTKTVNAPSFWDILSGKGGDTNRQKSTAVSKEKERVYPPEVFASLPDNQAIYYNKKTNEHTYLNVF